MRCWRHLASPRRRRRATGCGHEQPVPFRAAEADVAADFRAAESARSACRPGRRPARRRSRRPPSRRRPRCCRRCRPGCRRRSPRLFAVRASISIDTNCLPLRQFHAVDHVADLDVPRCLRVVRGPRVGDVQLLVVGREAQAVRLEELVGHLRRPCPLWIDAVDGLLDLQRLPCSLRSSSGCRSRGR